MPQSIDDLKRRVIAINEIFGTILDYHWSQLGTDKQQQLITGINKAYGQAKSFEHEYLTTLKEQGKGRSVITQTHADVTVGAADQEFAKSIEAKSVTAATKGEANTLIRKALEQLGGATGHLPRDGDVRILDIKIDGIENPWPLPGGEYGTPRTGAILSVIESEAQKELKSMVFNTAQNAPGAQSLVAWLQGEDFGGGQFQQITGLNSFHHTPPPINFWTPPVSVPSFPNSSRKMAQTSNGFVKVRCLTIKIRYNYGYYITDLSDQQCATCLDELVFQVYKNAFGKVEIELAKKKLWKFDRLDVFPPELVRL